MPNCLYLKDGRPYYANWDVLGVNVIQEFIVRHEEISNDAIDYLMAVPGPLTIYPHYWLKGLGVYLRHLELWVKSDFIELWKQRMADPELKYFPRETYAKFA